MDPGNLQKTACGKRVAGKNNGKPTTSYLFLAVEWRWGQLTHRFPSRDTSVFARVGHWGVQERGRICSVDTLNVVCSKVILPAKL